MALPIGLVQPRGIIDSMYPSHRQKKLQLNAALMLINTTLKLHTYNNHSNKIFDRLFIFPHRKHQSHTYVHKLEIVVLQRHPQINHAMSQLHIHT